MGQQVQCFGVVESVDFALVQILRSLEPPLRKLLPVPGGGSEIFGDCLRSLKNPSLRHYTDT